MCVLFTVVLWYFPPAKPDGAISRGCWLRHEYPPWPWAGEKPAYSSVRSALLQGCEINARTTTACVYISAHPRGARSLKRSTQASAPPSSSSSLSRTAPASCKATMAGDAAEFQRWTENHRNESTKLLKELAVIQVGRWLGLVLWFLTICQLQKGWRILTVCPAKTRK